MNSDLRADNNENYEMTGITSACDTGVLFWLTNDKESDQNVISKISSVQLEKELDFSVIHVIDNAKAAFIYNSISFIKNNFKDKKLFFHYAFGS
jgi:hypothetical protein